jgi:hypothetical protein
MSHRLVLSELRIMLEHFTTAADPDPDFMRSHVSALTSVVENWAEQAEAGEDRETGPLARLKHTG